MANLKKINRRSFTNNTQKVAWRLLRADGKWVSRSELERVATSAAARARDLRKKNFGHFKVECEPAKTLGKRGDQNTFFYRIPKTSVTNKQLEAIFRI